jgi:hypothetical protein
MSHCNLSHISNISNIGNTRNHWIEIIYIVRSTRLIKNIDRWGCFPVVTNYLIINQASFVKLLDLRIAVLIYKLSILIWSRCLTVILIAAIRKTSNVVCIVEELLMSLLRSFIHLLLVLTTFKLLLIHSLLLLQSLRILIFWNIPISVWLSCIHLKLLLILLLILLLLLLSSERVIGVVLVRRVVSWVKLIIRILVIWQSNCLY